MVIDEWWLMNGDWWMVIDEWWLMNGDWWMVINCVYAFFQWETYGNKSKNEKDRGNFLANLKLYSYSMGILQLWPWLLVKTRNQWWLMVINGASWLTVANSGEWWWNNWLFLWDYTVYKWVDLIGGLRLSVVKCHLLQQSDSDDGTSMIRGQFLQSHTNSSVFCHSVFQVLTLRIILTLLSFSFCLFCHT